MRRLHIALAVTKLEASIAEYNQRLSCKPVAIAESRYALWRTETLNLSISQNKQESGIRHLGFEDSEVIKMFSEHDADGIEWEYFTAAQQRLEIIKHYPDIDYPIAIIEKN